MNTNMGTIDAGGGVRASHQSTCVLPVVLSVHLSLAEKRVCSHWSDGSCRALNEFAQLAV